MATRKSGSNRKEAPRKELPAALRAIEVLRLVAELPGQMTLSDVAEVMGQSKSTVHRLAEQLSAAGFLFREPDQRNLWIGPRLREMSLDVVRNDFLRSAIRHTLRELVDEIGETCNIATLDGTEIIYLQRVEARWPLRLTLDLGSRIPVHCCASGKLFLALLDETARARLLRFSGMEPLTPGTITDRKLLLAELARIRKRGYSLDNEEFIPGMVAIAVPILNADGAIRAALSVHAPTVRFSSTEALLAFVPRLRKSAARIELAMAS